MSSPKPSWHGWITARLRVWREILWGLGKAVVVTIYGLVCLAEFARDHWAPAALKAKLRFVPNLTWEGWVIVGLALAVILTLEGAYRAVEKREKKIDEVERSAADKPSVEWSVAVHGSSLADIKVFIPEEPRESRYAIATDVTITNHGDQRISLSAELLLQWAEPISFPVVSAVGMVIPEWTDIPHVYGFSLKNQLLFPLTLEGKDSIIGHIVFQIPNVGVGVDRLGNNGLANPYEANEGPREREYRLRFLDLVSGDEKMEPIDHVYAPRFDGSGIDNRTDLATGGGAVTWIRR
jgi:hypothetical protein